MKRYSGIINSLDRVCFHEAAHLVVANALSLKYDHESIAILIKWKELHVTYIESEYRQSDKDIDILKKILCSLAGQEIELVKYGNVYKEGIISDNKNIEELFLHLHNGNIEITKQDVLIRCKGVCCGILYSNLSYIDEIVSQLKINPMLKKLKLLKYYLIQ